MDEVENVAVAVPVRAARKRRRVYEIDYDYHDDRGNEKVETERPRKRSRRTAPLAPMTVTGEVLVRAPSALVVALTQSQATELSALDAIALACEMERNDLSSRPEPLKSIRVRVTASSSALSASLFDPLVQPVQRERRGGRRLSQLHCIGDKLTVRQVPCNRQPTPRRNALTYIF